MAAKPSASPKVPTHARKRNRVRKGRIIKHTLTVEQRIDHIVGLMREMKFMTGKTGPQLAVKWGLSPETVKEYASEASRIVRASVIADRDRIGATIGAALDKAIHAATREKNWRVVAQLADTWAKISGVNAPKKLEHTGAGGAPIVFDLSGVTDEQIDALTLRLGEAVAGGEGDGEEGAAPRPEGGEGAPSGGDEGTS